MTTRSDQIEHNTRFADRGPRWVTAVSTVYYVGLAAVLAGAMTATLGAVLPQGVADQISHNSEGFLVAFVLSAWIQFYRPRMIGRRHWPVTIGIALVCVAWAIWLLMAADQGLYPFRISTLNETFFALGLLLPFLMLRRPQGRWPAAISLVVALVIVGSALIWGRASLLIPPAEILGFWLLAPVAFDVIDRGILDRSARTSAPVRCAWYVAMVAIPTAVIMAGAGARSRPGVSQIVDYTARLAEGWVAFLFIEVFFAVLLGRTGRTGRPAGEVPGSGGGSDPAAGDRATTSAKPLA